MREERRKTRREFSVDMIPPLMCLDALVEIRGPGGDPTIRLDDFFIGPGQTILKHGEILSKIVVPKMDPRTGGAYVKLMRRRAKLGGVAMGMGYALSEELVYCNGKLVNGNFLDYKLPTALDVPKVDVRFIESNDPNGPFGAKGLGEPSLVPTAPAIVNAIYDATGVRIKEIPVTQEKIQKALKERDRKGP